MAMTATWSATTPAAPIVNSPFSMVLTYSNASGSNVNITELTLYATHLNGSPAPEVVFGQVFLPPSVSAAAAAGTSQNLTLVPANSTATQSVTAVVLGNAMTVAQPSSASLSYQIQANIVSSDGSSFAPPPLNVSPQAAFLGKTQALEPTAVVPFGTLNFSSGINSALAPLLLGL